MTRRVVIVGGDAGGMAAVSQIRKHDPSAEIVALERSSWTSYAACGIPYLVAGLVGDGVERLVARSPDEHRRRGLDLRMHHEAVGIDLDRREVEVRDLTAGSTYRLGFDDLLLGTGGRPLRPPLPNIDAPYVHGVQTLDDASVLLDRARDVGAGRVVVVGSGYIGLEIAEAFLVRGAQVVVVEMAGWPMPTSFDEDIGDRVAEAMRRHGVDLRTGVEATGFEEGRVLTDDGALEADIVVLGIGVAPNADLAVAAGIPTGVKGAIRVDDRQQTLVDGVWAAGDCCESRHLVSGRATHLPLGTVANRQARVAGINIGGAEARFPGVLGTAISRICDTDIARTGLTTAAALEAGFDAVATTIRSSTAAHYMPEASPMWVRFVLDRSSGRLLGAQLVGGSGSGKRIDTCATAITAGMTAQDVLDLDLSYAPPFSPVWEPVSVAARESLKLL